MDSNNTKIRVASKQDAEQITKLKNQLHLNIIQQEAISGGFLLGTDIPTYRHYIENDYCLVAENKAGLTGFGIILKDETVKNSEIWAKRDQVNWNIDISINENSRICYFEQLGFLPNHSREALKVAFYLIMLAFESGHEHLLATTVIKPFINNSSIPFISASTGKIIGTITENYPEVGLVESIIHYINAESFFIKAKSHKLYPYLCDNYRFFREQNGN